MDNNPNSRPSYFSGHNSWNFPLSSPPPAHAAIPTAAQPPPRLRPWTPVVNKTDPWQQEHERAVEVRRMERKRMWAQRRRRPVQEAFNYQLKAWQGMNKIAKARTRMKTYLRRTIYWHQGNLDRQGWKAKKILGQGSYVSLVPSSIF